MTPSLVARYSEEKIFDFPAAIDGFGATSS